MLQFVIAGLVLGGIYAIASAGLVITYTSSGILNFAFGALAFFIARFYYYLHTQESWGIVPAAVVSIGIAAPALGVVLYAVLFRHLRLSSPLIKVVATIGLLVAIPSLATLIFGNQAIQQAPGLAPEPVHVYQFLGVPVTLDQIIVYICVLLTVVVGAVVLRYTDVGLKVRAMVDSPAMTDLSGTNPTTISVGVWAVSTFFAGLCGVLAAPIIGLDPDNFTLLIAASFAAVVAAKLRSLPIAVAVGLLMGVATSLFQRYLPPASNWTTEIIDAVPFMVIAVVLVYNLVRRGRVGDTEGWGGALDRAIMPQGESRLGGSTESVVEEASLNFFGKYAGPVVLIAVVAALPLIVQGYWVGLMAEAFAYGVIFLSWTIVTGEGGMLWLCQITFAGVGALTTAQLANNHGWPVLAAVVAGGVVALVMGIIVGFLSIRLGDLYVALVTLTFGLLMENLVFTLPSFVNQGLGLNLNRPSFATTDLSYTYVCLAAFIIIALFIVNFRRSTTGLALNAARWSEAGARTSGISVVQMKVIAGGLAALIAGIGGGLLALAQTTFQPSEFATFAGLVWLAVLVTIGVRSNAAALMAGLSFVMLPALTQAYLPTWTANILPVLFGLGAISAAKYPDGALAEQSRRLRRLLLHLSPGPPGNVATRRRTRPAAERARPRRRHAAGRRARLVMAATTDAVLQGAAAGSAVPALVAKDICVRFGGLMALSDVSLEIEPGSIAGLVGPNGAGKSTLLAVLSGLLRPNSGQVWLRGEDVTKSSARARATQGLARTFQQPEMFLGLTVREHLVLAHRARVARTRLWRDMFDPRCLLPPSSDENERVDGLLEVLRLTKVAKAPVAALPLGVVRLVEVGRALASDPRVLLLDEPLSGLDMKASENLLSVFRAIVERNAHGLSVIIVEHDVAAVLALSNTVFVLDFGERIAAGSPEHIRNDPAVRAAYLGDSEPPQRAAAPRPAPQATPGPTDGAGT